VCWPCFWFIVFRVSPRLSLFSTAFLLLLAVVGSRLAFRVIKTNTAIGCDGRRSQSADLWCRRRRQDGPTRTNNPEWNYLPVGFIDDDPLKRDKVIHGAYGFGRRNGRLADICREKNIAEILISARNMSPEQLKNVRDKQNNVVLKRCTDKDRTCRICLERTRQPAARWIPRYCRSRAGGRRRRCWGREGHAA